MEHKKRLSKKQIGILWMTIPFVVLMAVIIFYSIASFGISSAAATQFMSSGESSAVFGMARGLQVILSILGVIALIGSVIGIPVGLYFFSRVEPHEVSNLGRHAPYEGLSHEHVAYIAGWSWSAFFMHWIWTLCNRGVRFWTLGMFAPIVQQYVWIKIAMHGRRMSWESGKWQSFKEFRTRQRVLAWVSWVVAILGMILSIYIFTQFPKFIMKAAFPPSITADYHGDVSELDGFDPYTFGTSSGALNVADSQCAGLEDLDEDGLIDMWEVHLGSDPELQDTDGDGFGDKEELDNGFNPGGTGQLDEAQKIQYPIHQRFAERCL